VLVLLLSLVLAFGAQAQVDVLTYRNNLARSGANLEETTLTPANVDVSRFGKLFSQAVDGQVYAQPLYLSALAIPDEGVHDVVFVATEHNSIYAFDADSGSGANTAPLWHVNLTDRAAGETTVSAAQAMNCPSITPEIGITGTPVIDPTTGTLYVISATMRGESFFHRLHALDVATGAERPGSPVTVEASVPGAGGDFFSRSPVDFLPYFQMNRAGLLLLNGVVYTAWGSYCDSRSYHGWVIAFDAGDLHRVSVFNSTPNGNQGSFWMGGSAPAADPEGNIYAVSANGDFDSNTGGTDFGDTVLKLFSPALVPADFFTPFNQEHLDQADIDLGSSGALLLPDSAGSAAHPHLLVSAGKEGRIYLLDRDHLGGFSAAGDHQIVQSIQDAVGPLFGGPAYYNGYIYFAAAKDRVKAFSISQARIGMSPSSQSATVIPYPGAVPAISANGNANGIVWLIEAGTQGVLHAYDAANLRRELYNSGQNAARDAPGPLIKFSVPTIANGRVYVGTANSLTVFGFLN
jgi:hypothetical protein